MFKLYEHNKYINEYGLYYVYMHIYEGRILYVGKGTRGRCGKLTDSRSTEYIEFLNSINKNDIEKYIVFESYDEGLVLACERLIHDELDAIGYKVFSKANGCRIKGNKLTSIQRKNISESMTNKNGKAIVQLSLDNKFIKEFPSLANASKELKISKSNLCKVLKNERNLCGGFKWSYKNTYEELIRTRQLPSSIIVYIINKEYTNLT